MGALRPPTSKRSGFTLLELSIVLVIIGLLSSGIIAGKYLIRLAELQTISTDVNRYRSAIFMFRDRFRSLPGDMPNAAQFWGVLAGTGSDATCQDTEAIGLPTCNGDGDGFIGTSSLDGVTWAERFRAWQHLANAGLVQRHYTGRTDSVVSGSFVITPNKNAPAGRLGTTHFRFVSQAQASSILYDNLSFDGKPAGNYIEFRGTSGDYTAGPPVNAVAPLNPVELYSIDAKLDDGKPGTGFVTTQRLTSANWPNCSSSDDRSTAVYRVSDTSKLCVMDVAF